MNRSEKAEAIVELNQIFKDANLMVVTRQSGLTVQEDLVQLDDRFGLFRTIHGFLQ